MVREKGDSSIPGVSPSRIGLKKQDHDKISAQF